MKKDIRDIYMTVKFLSESGMVRILFFNVVYFKMEEFMNIISFESWWGFDSNCKDSFLNVKCKNDGLA